jgi:hypothetical protein
MMRSACCKLFNSAASYNVCRRQGKNSLNFRETVCLGHIKELCFVDSLESDAGRHSVSERNLKWAHKG